MNVSKRPLGNGLGWSVPEIEHYLVKIRKACYDVSVHSYK